MMKNISLLAALLAFFVSGQGYGQAASQCADSHIRKSARVALATAAQQRLMNKYDVNFYKLDIALERTSTFVQGSALIKATSTVATLDTFAFELHQNLNIDSVVLNGQNRAFTRQTGMVYVHLTNPLATGTAIAARVYYKGTPPAPGSAAIGEGMSNAFSPTWGAQVTWSLSQPFSAYEWFPVKQVLTDKADSSEVWVTTSATNKVGSNGLLKNTTPMAGGKVRYEWKSQYPIAYYLISVAVSNYIDYTIFANPAGAPNPIPIQNYIYSNPATLTSFQNDINDTAPMLVTFSDLFGLYPFHKEKYGHSMAPLSGGMEHQTMTTQGFFEFTLTAHELGHQWFGDHVTCGSWQDIWLNEGFASYCEYIALQNLRPAQARNWMNNTHNPVLNMGGGSVYVPAADSMNVNRIFSGTLSYNKGAAVLHTLRFEMNNDSLFFTTLKTFSNQFGNGTAKTPDFKQVAETVSGKNLTTFFDQWIYGQGFPTFSIDWNQVGQNLIMKVTQTVSRPAITPFFETDVEYRLLTNQGPVIIRVPQNQAVQYYTIPVNGQVNAIEVDPNQWLLNRTGQIFRDTNLVTGTKEDARTAAVSLFPNPVSGWLQLSGLSFKPQTVRILNAIGQEVMHEKLDPVSELKLNVSALPAGVYLLQLEGQERSISKTFLKE
ncbi:MAG TPA: M1 family aminopeptidase [Adhaeribacter sp.]|nr:M1 family aminopeptidase [Adhaeribacter sp.]